MKFLLLVSLLFATQLIAVREAQACWGCASDGDILTDFACLSLDGVPIAHGSSLDSKCCQGGHADPSCKIGFSSILGASAGDASAQIHMAQNELGVADALAGGAMDHTAPKSSTPAAPNALSSALLSSGNSADGLSSASDGPEDSKNAAGSGSGGAQGSGGFGSGVGGLSSASQTHGLKTASLGPSGPDAGGGYKGGAAVEAKKDGEEAGKVETDLKGVSFGAAGAGGPGGLTNGTDLDFPGSRADSPDYLNRIDKSASIFKIVSKRYEKETARKHVLVVEIH